MQVRLLSAAKLNQRSGIHTETGFGVTVVMVVVERTLQHVSFMLAGAGVSCSQPSGFNWPIRTSYMMTFGTCKELFFCL